MVIYHIARAREWQAAQPSGAYQISTRDRTLEEVGFIHCSYAHQVAGVANAFYQGEPDLVLLLIDTDGLDAPLKVEPPAPGMEAFPHVYGPLNVDAVVEVLPYAPSAEGRFLPPSQ